MPLDKPEADTPSLIARARKALAGVETGPSVIARHAKTAPGGPGVYRMIDESGEVLYIGKARGLKKRVQSYARAQAQNNRIARMVADTASMEFVTTPTETEALLLEANLIKRLKPRFNVVFDDKGAVGRRYRRQDEAGTPFCVTIDGQTMTDDTVTVRDRDTLKQERVPMGQVRAVVEKALSPRKFGTAR